MIRSYLAVDIETTGLSPEQDRIIEIGAVRYIEGTAKEEFSMFVNPERMLPERIQNLTGITDEMLNDAPKEKEAIKKFLEFCDGWILLGHNLPFDYSFLKTAAIRNEVDLGQRGIDTLALCRTLHSELSTRNLAAMCSYYGIVNERAHRALEDAKAAAKLYECLIERFGTNHSELFQETLFQYHPKKQEPITQKQKKYLLGLIQQYQLNLEQEVDQLTKSEASRKIDHIISTYGRTIVRK